MLILFFTSLVYVWVRICIASLRAAWFRILRRRSAFQRGSPQLLTTLIRTSSADVRFHQPGYATTFWTLQNRLHLLHV